MDVYIVTYLATGKCLALSYNPTNREVIDALKMSDPIDIKTKLYDKVTENDWAVIKTKLIGYVPTVEYIQYPSSPNSPPTYMDIKGNRIL